MILVLIVVTMIYIGIGVKLMSALDTFNANLAVLNTNIPIVVALAQKPGLYTEAEVQAGADAIKLASNTLAAGAPGTTLIP